MDNSRIRLNSASGVSSAVDWQLILVIAIALSAAPLTESNEQGTSVGFWREGDVALHAFCCGCRHFVIKGAQILLGTTDMS